jgi:hypothetical protein
MDIDLAALPTDVETLQRIVYSLVAERTSPGEAKAEIGSTSSSKSFIATSLARAG